jgi:purine-binding chemotaxis protein CheW
MTAIGNERAGKYLTFVMGKEEFGVAVLKVREIMGVQEITATPLAPVHFKGVMNLRGRIVPVVDLRLKFGIEAAGYTERTCIVVMEVKGASGPLLIGAIVDEVSEVLTLAAGDIEDTPDFGGEQKTPCILGLAKSRGRVKILLDVDEALASTELYQLPAFE